MAKIFHAHLHGDRETKYDRLMESDISNTTWSEISPQTPFYLLIPQDNRLLAEYDQGWKITDIFPISSMGITTGDDNRFVAFNDDELAISCGDISDVIDVAYRPFDNRRLLYSPKLLARARTDYMKHFMNHYNNLSLITIRRPRNGEVDNFFISDRATDKCAISSLDNAQLFALYLYPEQTSLKELEELGRPNLSQPFLNDITAKLGYTPTPEAIFHYIYAIFHSPTYRSRYAEFLKIDFPRVPLTRNDTLFRQLAAHGEQLVALHLMKSDTLTQTHQHPQFVEQGGNCIVDPAHPKYEINTRSVIINKKGDRFTDIPQAVWNFYVGGYPVCAKWLKDRKGRTLSPQDITHYQQIVVALDETIKLMTAIDQVIPGFPIE